MTITTIIIALTCFISYMAFNNRELMNKLLHVPRLEKNDGQYYRLLTSGFIHGSWLHLGVNMFVFYMFGSFVEKELIGQGYFPQFNLGPVVGSTVFVLLYLATIVLANLGTYFSRQNDYSFASLGASGAVSGATMCYAMFLPWQKVYLYGIIGIPAIITSVLYIAYSQYSVKNSQDNIDHSAHLYGALAMPILLMFITPQLFSHFISRFLAVFN